MKKVGIVTYHNSHNYGAMLQAYALRYSCLKYVEEAYLVDYIDAHVDNSHHIFHKPAKGENKVIHYAKKIMGFPLNYKRFKNFNTFSKNHLNVTRQSFRGDNEFFNNTLAFDAFITGSDQVWNPDITEGYKNAYLLEMKNKEAKRISYAPSIGKNSLKQEEIDRLLQAISQFSSISVREQSAEKMLHDCIDKKIEIVLDPTLLLTKEEWDTIIPKTLSVSNYILVYTVESNANVTYIVNEVARALGKKIVFFDKFSEYINHPKSVNTAGPYEFLSLFKNADFVITNSFHGTVFSLLFEKKFLTIPHQTRGVRLIDLLSKVQLKDRIVYTKEDLKKVDINQNIDYNSVNYILETERKKSLLFLENSLK